MASAWFPKHEGGNYRIPLQIQSAHGSMTEIPIIFDTGNDITLLKADTAQHLGYDPHNMEGHVFPVTGITGAGQPFRKVSVMIRIGQLRPIMIEMGMALQQESLAEDLFGRKDVMDGAYTVSQDEQGIAFTEKHPAVAMLANAGSRIPNKLRETFRGYRVSY
jgi:hypothetical protein